MAEQAAYLMVEPLLPPGWDTARSNRCFKAEAVYDLQDADSVLYEVFRPWGCFWPG